MYIKNYRTLETADSIYSYIVDYTTYYMYPPTFSEIRSSCHLKSNKSIIQYLNILSDMGYLSYSELSSRSIMLHDFKVIFDDSFNLGNYNLAPIDIDLYSKMKTFFMAHLYPPSMEDILSFDILHSKSSISSHLKKLHAKELIVLSDNRSSRSIRFNHCKIVHE